MELLVYHEYGISKLHFRDDNFVLVNNEMPRLLAFLKRHHFTWSCEVRLDMLSDQMAQEWVQAGLTEIRVSVETLNSTTLKRIGKEYRNHGLFAERIRTLTDLGCFVRVSFMLGIPGDTRDDILRTFDYAEKLRPAQSVFGPYEPLPGTPIYWSPEKHGIRRVLDYEELGDYSVIETEELTNQEINCLLDEALRRFPETELYDWSRK